MPHGFLNFGQPIVGKACFAKAQELAKDFIVELIEAPDL